MRVELKKGLGWMMAALLLAALLFAAPAGAEETEGNDLPEWTVMFYLCGSDLESKYGYASGNLAEILSCNTYDAIRSLTDNSKEREKTGKPVNVTLQTGGSREWHAQEMNMDIRADRLQRWHYEPVERVDYVNNNQFILDAELPLASMSAPETLADFIRWSAENFPAKKYCLVLWDHGGGAMTGLFIDELFDGDILYLDELRQAMEGGGVVFETVLFDACLMANLETACAIQPYARWMVGSEEVVAGNGTAMYDWLQQLYYTPQWDGRRLGRWICDMTQKKYAKEEDAQAQDTLTWSVIDLSQIPRVAEYFDRFFEWVGKIYAERPHDMKSICSYLTDLFEYGAGGENMDDLSDILYQELIPAIIDPEIYNGLMDALMDAVVYSIRSPERSTALGLSFYDIDGNTPAELDSYARNCPSPHYLAFLDAITPGWNAPETVYEQAERLPGILDIKDYEVTIEKRFDADGTPGILISNGFTNMRTVHADLLRLNPDTGNILRMGTTITVPNMTEDGSMLFAFRSFWKAPAIEGVHCDAELISRYYNIDTYNIPVRVGAKQCLLRCSKNSDINELTIHGLWDGYDSDRNMFGRSIMPLSSLAGQEFALLYPIDGSDQSGRTQYEASEPMTMYRALEIKPKSLEAGTYYLDYWVEDIFTHHMKAGRVGLEWDGEKLSLQEGEEWAGTMTLVVPAE